ncbi:hypothetical protein BCR33DRAFT_822536 [Rhizoclosmatium globosum]|uniref:Reverse transcriptase domain-containing protein n=1 Tax=Rhizoclosmatium globosum TaxID=329046 RepID=A0A1Y2C6E7_9FUNG|nr:hypothetical protein BCR33DRAFT_822536 [Rhizoclosmatium globosum]|eukprot:ORY42506.1 hypothetical protein BCR33DRAFT_822536 [Rhizoclosmatium globosum]
MSRNCLVPAAVQHCHQLASWRSSHQLYCSLLYLGWVVSYQLTFLLADDSSILVRDPVVAQQQLDFCEAWSIRHGFRFSPSKCNVVAPFPVQLTLYGEALPQVDSAKYLGVFMTAKGIDWELSNEHRVDKALKTASWLGRVGANHSGDCPISSISKYVQPFPAGVCFPIVLSVKGGMQESPGSSELCLAKNLWH